MYTSKYYTVEEIDERLLQGYYNDAVEAGFVGTKQEFLKFLVDLSKGNTESSLPLTGIRPVVDGILDHRVKVNSVSLNLNETANTKAGEGVYWYLLEERFIYAKLSGGSLAYYNNWAGDPLRNSSFYRWDSNWKTRQNIFKFNGEYHIVETNQVVGMEGYKTKLNFTKFELEGTGGTNASVKGYISIGSLEELPQNPTAEQKTLGFLIGEDIYVYVEKGGDTLGGKYKNCGKFRGPKGDKGDKLTFSDLSESDKQELKGEPGSSPTIGENGNWVVNGMDTGLPSRGEPGSGGVESDRPATQTSMGYNILKKELSFKEQVTEPNTIYEIRDEFDLGNAGESKENPSIEIPLNSAIKFNGGKLSNGKIKGNQTEIVADLNQIFDSVSFEGNFKCKKTYPEWFGAKHLVKRTILDEDALSSVVFLPPAELDTLEDSSKAIQDALNLSVIAGCTTFLSGFIYRIDNEVNFPEKVTLETVPETLVFPVMQGDGLNVTTQNDKEPGDAVTEDFVTETLSSPVRKIRANQYIATKSMKIAFHLHSMYNNFIGGGVISLVKSKYTIGIYIDGYGLREMDMTFMSPNINIVTVGGDHGHVTAPDSDSIDITDKPSQPTEEEATKLVRGETRWDTVHEQIYAWSGSEWWKQGKSTNCEYNTSLRMEILSGWGGGGRIINPQICLRDSFGYRGIEILTRAGGWTNKGLWTGSVSYKCGNYVSIYTNYDVGFHDMSNMQMQYSGAAVTHDTRFVFAIRSGYNKFPFPWDAVNVGGLRVKYLWELGSGTIGNEILLDNTNWYIDKGKENIWNMPTKLRNKILEVKIDTSIYENILKYRTAYNYFGSTETKPSIEVYKSEHNFDDDFSELTPDLTYNYKKEWSDLDAHTSFKILNKDDFFAKVTIENKNNFFVKYFSRGYIVVHYRAQNGDGVQSPDRLDWYCEGKVYQGNYNGTTSYVILPLRDRESKEISFSIKKLVNQVQSLIIYNVELYFSKYELREFRLPLDFGDTKHRPNAAPNGFQYYDTTLKSLLVNKGTSINVDYQPILINSDIPQIKHPSSELSISLTPNEYHVWGKIEGTLNITLAAGKPNIYNEYMFEFESSTNTILKLPSNVVWINNKPLVIKENKKYVISIVNNKAIGGEF